MIKSAFYLLVFLFSNNFNLGCSFSARGYVRTISAIEKYASSAISADFTSNINRPSSIEYPVCVVLGNEKSYSHFLNKPFRSPVTWLDVFKHVNEKCSWEYLDSKQDINLINAGLDIVFLNHFQDNAAIPTRPIYILVGIEGEKRGILESALSGAQAVVVFDSSPEICSLQKFGDYYPESKDSFLEGFLSYWDDLLKTPRRAHKKTYLICQDMWLRRSSDDLVFMILVLIDAFTDKTIKSVQSVSSTEQTNLKQVASMCKNCAKEMVDCLTDPLCRKALDCLNSCKGNDQVCSYRCITSHESVKFEKFAYCILQKNNCMGNSATIPTYPNPAPLAQFRGSPLTHEIAEGIFFGHLQPYHAKSASEDSDGQQLDTISKQSENLLRTDLNPTPSYEQWSWKVVCGQNPAYDYFGCQHQLFYRDVRKPAIVWYDPVFKVTTVYGEDVWRRRHYRVRRGKTPGQFYFSVLDNGVASNEFWRILDCADDLSWAVFYYSGAASAAGTNYRGALVVTQDGSWPVMSQETTARIRGSLAKAGIQMWELFEVCNKDCNASSSAGPPPLGIAAAY